LLFLGVKFLSFTSQRFFIEKRETYENLKEEKIYEFLQIFYSVGLEETKKIILKRGEKLLSKNFFNKTKYMSLF